MTEDNVKQADGSGNSFEGPHGNTTIICHDSQELYFSMIGCGVESAPISRLARRSSALWSKARSRRSSRLLKNDERMLLGLVNAPYSFVKRQVGGNIHEGVVIHGVNTMIYALKIVIDIGIPDDRILYIGIAALCKNLGLLAAEPGGQAADAGGGPPPGGSPPADLRKYINLLRINDSMPTHWNFSSTCCKRRGMSSIRPR